MGWAEACLGDIALNVRRKESPKTYSHLPFIGMEHVEAHTMKLLGTVPASMMRSNAVHFYPHDVLYGRLRPYLNKVLVAKSEGMCSAEFIPLTTPDGVEPRYLAYSLNSANFFSFASHINEGDRPRVDYGEIAGYQLPLAPSHEQHRIVDAIESHLTRLDAAVTTLQRVEATLRRYRASVLKAAIEGRLVPTEAELARKEGREYEPAAVLLDRVLKERRRRWEEAELAKLKATGKTPKDDRWKSKYEEPVAPDTSKLPELPEGWRWVSVRQLVWSVKDGPHYSPKYSEEGIPFITGGNVRPNGVDFANAKRISPELHEELSKRCKPERGDILYTKGGTTGIARVNTYDSEFSVWVHVAVLKLAGLVEPFYVQHALNSPFCYAQAQRHTHGVGNQDLGLTRMINIVFAIPPVAEQRRIIQDVDRRLSVADEIDLLTETSRVRCQRLRQAILKWAFEGKLVDQDPTDEPASALLERIEAQRQKTQAEGDGNPRRKRKMA